MQLDYALFAEKAEISESGKIHLFGGDISTLTVPQLPGMIPPIYLIMKFEVDPSDAGSRHSLQLKLKTPDGTLVTLTDAVQISAELNTHNPNWPSGAAAVVNCNFGLNVAGEYRMQICLDDHIVKSLPLYVIVGPIQETQPQRVRDAVTTQ